MAGYIMLQANSLEQATALAQSCPLLEWFDIVVRPMVPRSNA